jgi:hypothetical protein
VLPLCCLLRLAGQRWRYSNPPPHGVIPTEQSVLFKYLHSEPSGNLETHITTNQCPSLNYNNLNSKTEHKRPPCSATLPSRNRISAAHRSRAPSKPTTRPISVPHGLRSTRLRDILIFDNNCTITPISIGRRGLGRVARINELDFVNERQAYGKLARSWVILAGSSIIAA